MESRGAAVFAVSVAVVFMVCFGDRSGLFVVAVICADALFLALLGAGRLANGRPRAVGVTLGSDLHTVRVCLLRAGFVLEQLAADAAGVVFDVAGGVAGCGFRSGLFRRVRNGGFGNHRVDNSEDEDFT